MSVPNKRLHVATKAHGAEIISRFCCPCSFGDEEEFLVLVARAGAQWHKYKFD